MSQSQSPVTADWIAHCGPVTCMAARPTGVRAVSVAAETPATATGGYKTRLGSRSSRSLGRLDLGGSWSGAVTASAAVGGGGGGGSSLYARPPTLATGGGDGKVKVWTDEGWVGGGAEGLENDSFCGDANSVGGRTGSTGHEGAVLSVCWHPEGEVIASSGQDWAVWLWDAEGRALSYLHAHRRWTQALTFSAAGDFLVSCGAAEFEGWAVDVAGGSDDRQVMLCWRQPLRLVATSAEVRLQEECRARTL